MSFGGLRSAMMNEVLQFFLIWAGALVVPILGLVETGDWTGLKVRIITNTGSDNYLHLWTTLGHFKIELAVLPDGNSNGNTSCLTAPPRHLLRWF
ncbi:MAG: hypothetical protein BGO25_04760 [Acidobacteriales bacterium 59-55]|nr:hypothetical protein [Terriglobales bacterium]OJV44416.1 MAG: hypothetical protein BGO25_04760 [Acidobacteriales bacterium 59-55]